MTQYDDFKKHLAQFPGSTRETMRRMIPHITHEHEMCKRLIDSGDGYREQIEHTDRYGKTRLVWAYYLN